MDPSATGVADPRTKLFLVDAQLTSRDGLRALANAQPDFFVVGACASASKRTSYHGVPDVVVADVDLPDAQGAEAVRLLRLKFPASALLVLTLVAEPAAVQRVLDAGVDGYMLKSAAPGQFFFALRAVAGGATYLQPSLGIELARAWSASSAPARKGRLSLKETDLVRLVARGHTNREIAAQRCVSLRTIEAQRANVVVKLGLHTRAELSRYARSIGLDAFAV